MPALSFTLILTKGTHLIGAAAAERILRAVAEREPLVEVELDLFGSASSMRTATLATAHVVALTANPTMDDEPSFARVSTVLPLPRNRR